MRNNNIYCRRPRAGREVGFVTKADGFIAEASSALLEADLALLQSGVHLREPKRFVGAALRGRPQKTGQPLGLPLK